MAAEHSSPGAGCIASSRGAAHSEGAAGEPSSLEGNSLEVPFGTAPQSGCSEGSPKLPSEETKRQVNLPGAEMGNVWADGPAGKENSDKVKARGIGVKSPEISG